MQCVRLTIYCILYIVQCAHCRMFSNKFAAHYIAENNIITKDLLLFYKLDGVGPVHNRPSTDKLQHFVQKKKKKWQVTCDMWHVTCDMWHVTRGTLWHVTRDMFWGVNILSKFQLPSSYRLWFMILWRSRGNGWLNELINYLMTRLFIEQPRLHRVC